MLISMKKKLNLDKLKVESFVTYQNVGNIELIKGGEPDTAIKKCRPTQPFQCDPDDFFSAKLCSKDQRAC